MKTSEDLLSHESERVAQAIIANEWQTARMHCEKILASEPDSPGVQHSLGLICWGEGDLNRALAHFQQATTCNPEQTVWLNNLGVIYSILQQWDDAATVFSRCVALNPQDIDALSHHGRALSELGRDEQACDVLARAVAAEPERAVAWTDLGRSLTRTNRLEEAYEALHQSLKLAPESARTRELLAQLCQRMKLFEEAVRHARELTDLRPDGPAFAGLAIAHWEGGDLEQALTASELAFSYGITSPHVHSGLLYLLQFDPSQSGLSLAAAHRQWAFTHSPANNVEPRFDNIPDAKRRLRVGYVGSGLFTTPARYFRVPVLRSHDRQFFETYIYDTQPDTGWNHEEYHSLADVRRDVSRLSDEALATMIRQDRIDILVDLLGHHSFNRLRVFGLRSAPVQAGYASYPGTTGLSEIDWMFTDLRTTPYGSESEYAEQVYRLPVGCLVYEPPECAGPVTSLPAIENGYVTFGLFQRAAKLGDQCWDAVARILLATPSSRLLIHHGGREFDCEGSLTRRLICGALTCRGIDLEIVSFCGTRSLHEHLSVLGQTDIALDTFPYNGQTTTCECLWMGVPVITLSGSTHASRIGAALLHQAGCGEWVAYSDDEYVTIATRVAEDTCRLSKVRQELRGRIAASPLTDVVGRTREMEAAYRRMWRGWCEQQTGFLRT